MAKIEKTPAFKAFDANMQCRGFQYATGKTFEEKGQIRICNSGFHACENPLDVLNYYPLVGSKFARVTIAGAIDRETGGDSKICGGKITIEAELRLPDFIKAAVSWIVGATDDHITTGYGSHAASTGNRSHAASTGDSSHAASTGDSSHAASTGNRSHAASTGDSSHAASTGYGSHAASTGDSSVSASVGIYGTVTAGEGGAIMLAYYNDQVYPPKLQRVAAFMVGEQGVEAGKTYKLSSDGTPVECSPAA